MPRPRCRKCGHAWSTHKSATWRPHERGHCNGYLEPTTDQRGLPVDDRECPCEYYEPAETS